jgi:hypothetical protein
MSGLSDGQILDEHDRSHYLRAEESNKPYRALNTLFKSTPTHAFFWKLVITHVSKCMETTPCSNRFWECECRIVWEQQLSQQIRTPTTRNKPAHHTCSNQLWTYRKGI